eukprot:2456950-Pleurochrysis_carterae.AAC.3
MTRLVSCEIARLGLRCFSAFQFEHTWIMVTFTFSGDIFRRLGKEFTSCTQGLIVDVSTLVLAGEVSAKAHTERCTREHCGSNRLPLPTHATDWLQLVLGRVPDIDDVAGARHTSSNFAVHDPAHFDGGPWLAGNWSTANLKRAYG